MKPAARVWRKATRAAAKRRPGRHYNRKVLIQAPRRGSTWLRRHPGEFGYWLDYVGKRPIDRAKLPAQQDGDVQ